MSNIDSMHKYRKTKNGLVCVIFNNEKIRCKRLNRPAPKYDLIQFRNWVLSQEVFHDLYDKWVESGYDQKLKPSIDQSNDYEFYTLDNIRIVTWGENNERGSNDQILGINTKNCTKVIQMDRNGNQINEFHSIRSAGRETGIDSGNINLVCNGKRLTAGGYKWKKID